jgi:hypothetical protein
MLQMLTHRCKTDLGSCACCFVQYERLYISVTAENERLRAENGELLRGLNSHAERLRAENSTLQVRLDRTQQELEKLRKMHAAAQSPCGLSKAVTTPHGVAGVPELDGIAEDQNLFELRIDKGDLDVSSHVATFITLDFYDHPTQVQSNILSPVAATAMYQGGEQVVHACPTSHGHPVFSSVILSQLPSPAGGARSHVLCPAQRMKHHSLKACILRPG